MHVHFSYVDKLKLFKTNLNCFLEEGKEKHRVISLQCLLSHLALEWIPLLYSNKGHWNRKFYIYEDVLAMPDLNLQHSIYGTVEEFALSMHL